MTGKNLHLHQPRRGGQSSSRGRSSRSGSGANQPPELIHKNEIQAPERRKNHGACTGAFVLAPLRGFRLSSIPDRGLVHFAGAGRTAPPATALSAPPGRKAQTMQSPINSTPSYTLAECTA